MPIATMRRHDSFVAYLSYLSYRSFLSYANYGRIDRRIQAATRKVFRRPIRSDTAAAGAKAKSTQNPRNGSPRMRIESAALTTAWR